MTSKNLNFHFKTHLYRQDHGFGPGVAKIMELVAENGSLTKAYDSMGLSSSKGWKMVKRAEDDLGFPLIISTVGGSGGGNSKLSPEGEDFLNKYKRFNQELAQASQLIFEDVFQDYL